MLGECPEGISPGECGCWLTLMYVRFELCAPCIGLSDTVICGFEYRFSLGVLLAIKDV